MSGSNMTKTPLMILKHPAVRNDNNQFPVTSLNQPTNEKWENMTQTYIKIKSICLKN